MPPTPPTPTTSYTPFADDTGSGLAPVPAGRESIVPKRTSTRSPTDNNTPSMRGKAPAPEISPVASSYEPASVAVVATLTASAPARLDTVLTAKGATP